MPSPEAYEIWLGLSLSFMKSGCREQLIKTHKVVILQKSIQGHRVRNQVNSQDHWIVCFFHQMWSRSQSNKGQVLVPVSSLHNPGKQQTFRFWGYPGGRSWGARKLHRCVRDHTQRVSWEAQHQRADVVYKTFRKAVPPKVFSVCRFLEIVQWRWKTSTINVGLLILSWFTSHLSKVYLN